MLHQMANPDIQQIIKVSADISGFFLALNVIFISQLYAFLHIEYAYLQLKLDTKLDTKSPDG